MGVVRPRGPVHLVGRSPVDVFWDFRNARFSDGSEPHSDYYVAVVSHDEVVLLIGDLKREAYRRTGSRPALIDAILLSKEEHLLGKKRFSTRARFHEKGKSHEISVECEHHGGGSNSSSRVTDMDSEMVVRIDGGVAIQVRRLQWKFRGNESISIGGLRVEVYWDVHDWLFSPGMRHALFVFKPESSRPSSSSSLCSSSSNDGRGSTANGNGSSEFSLFLHAWKLE